jgi:hypothetical protein
VLPPVVGFPVVGFFLGWISCLGVAVLGCSFVGVAACGSSFFGLALTGITIGETVGGGAVPSCNRSKYSANGLNLLPCSIAKVFNCIASSSVNSNLKAFIMCTFYVHEIQRYSLYVHVKYIICTSYVAQPPPIPISHRIRQASAVDCPITATPQRVSTQQDNTQRHTTQGVGQTSRAMTDKNGKT